MQHRFFLALVFCISLISSVAAQNESAAPDNKRAVLAEVGRSLRWWDEDASKKPYSWYRSEDGLRMAENILSWQDNGTGWPLMSTVREPFTGDMSKAGPWGKKAALVKATVNEMRFLARGYVATQDERYKTAVLGGLDYLLEAQLETGGWPHQLYVREARRM
ncbi:MAG TPA: pectate lyase, partial [Flavilitoribacter sp.]|nr:pectate lyase [Flavilitoribacter sp.]